VEEGLILREGRSSLYFLDTLTRHLASELTYN
jgi:hypothetical protein